METYLTPIEKPSSLGMKVAFFFTRKKFGKVLMPLKVHSARLPSAFGMYYSKVPQLDQKLTLDKEIVQLIREQVSRLNQCLFCMDASRFEALKGSMNIAKFNALLDFRTAPVFSERERVALEYVTELTADKKVSPDTFERLAAAYTEVQICEIVWLVASEHLYNMTNIGLNIHSDKLCEIHFNK